MSNLIDGVRVGEALVGEGNEVAHIDLLIGPSGTAVETAFCVGLTNNKEGFTSLLAVVSPNAPTRPHTLMFNKVTLKGATQAVQMFGPAQRGVARAVMESVVAGIIPAEQAHDLYLCVGVFVHWEAQDDARIERYNFDATRLAIERAVGNRPTVQEAIDSRTLPHPFAPNVV